MFYYGLSLIWFIKIFWSIKVILVVLLFMDHTMDFLSRELYSDMWIVVIDPRIEHKLC